MRKKGIRRMLLAVGLMLLIFVGWGKQPVQLLNETPPLIDLDAAIQEANFGNNGNPGGETGDPDQDNPGGNGGNTQQPERSKTIFVYVRDEVIRYDDLSPVRDVDELKKKLTQDLRTGDSIRLVEDYAEAHCFRQVMKLLDDLRSEKGYEYNVTMKE